MTSSDALVLRPEKAQVAGSSSVVPAIHSKRYQSASWEFFV
jgi:hypothetical protein